MSLTRGHSCVLCQQRKVRCDQQKPCVNCVRAQVECRVVPSQPVRRRKKKLHERDLVERLKKYEALMTQNGINFDSVLEGGDEIGDLDTDLTGLKTSPGGGVQDCASRREDSGKLSKRVAYYDEYRTSYDLLYSSSDEEHNRPTNDHAFDTMFSDTNGFPFFVGGSPTRITHLHPSAIQIFQLWQVYINNVNPLLKISHVPTLQTQIVGAGADLAKCPRPLEALMFCIYLIAVKSMADEEVQTAFDETKAVLLARYNEASQQALINASFMRSNELIVLQAYLLYLLSLGRNVDPRSQFCLVGIAVRVATRLGLHRDEVQFGLSPFETEQRRRLWWQLVTLDKRNAEIAGSAITALSSSGTNCRLPLNVNDTDLHPHAKDPPGPYTGPTEMLFCLTRIELTIAAAPDSIRPNPSIVKNPHNPRGPPTFPDAGTREASRPSLHDLDDYCSYIESVYLEHCDSKIPIQFFTLIATRTSLCKLRVIDFMSRGIPTSNLDDRERDALFLCAIQMLEYDDMIYTTESLRGFLWYTQLQGPLPGYIFLASELRQRTAGELCERAWKAICNNYDHRSLVRNLRNPMHVAFGHAILKAWNAREQAELQLGRAIEQPNLVTLMRQRLSSKATGSRTAPDPPHARGIATGPGHGPAGVATGGPTAGSGMPSRPEGMYQTSETILDDEIMFPSLESTSQIDGAACPDYDQIDWAYLMQSGALGGPFQHNL